MNIQRIHLLGLAGILFSLPLALFGQPKAPRATASPLALPRLKSTINPGDAAALDASQFTMDTLAPRGVPGATTGKRNDADYLALPAGREWSRPLRGNPNDATFVSFHVYGSHTTVIDIGGARLGLAAGPIAGSLQLMYDGSTTGAFEWKSLNVHVASAKYGGQDLAALPPLTVLLDPAGTWTLFLGSRLLGTDLPVIEARRNNRQFTVKAGTGGAWVVGLVLSDENPLYEDTNANGIEDQFEMTQRGALLPSKASKVERDAVMLQWKNAQRGRRPPAVFAPRPMPD
jgi:hypothetical protein